MSRLLATADQFADGKLEQLVREHHAAGASFEAIAQELRVKHNVRVTGQTVRVWAQRLGIDTSRKEAS